MSSFAPRRFLAVLPFFAALCFVDASSLEGQRVRAFYMSTSSDNAEIDDATGFGVRVGIPTPFGIEARLGLRRVSDDFSRTDFLCVSYGPDVSCVTGQVDSETTFTHFTAGLGFPFDVVPMFTLTPAADVSMTQIDHKSSTDSRRAPNAFFPNSAQLGGVLSLEAALNPVPGVPLGLSVAVNRRWINFNGCSTETAGVYAPFCETTPFTEIEIGAEFRVR